MLTVVFWIFCIVITVILAANKGRSMLGWGILSLFVGPLAWVVYILPPLQQEGQTGSAVQAMSAIPVQSLSRPVPGDTDGQDWKTCPYCAEQVRRKAIKCKHCLSDLPKDLDQHENAMGGVSGGDQDERLLCPDGRCTGTLGIDGKCRLCGEQG
jgi:hypothetical protein